MITKSKYVVGEISTGIATMLAAVVFCEYVPHISMIRLFEPGTIRSAGFCYISDDDVQVFGESVGLHTKSLPEDARLIGRAIAHQKYC
jgi:hypothetical protein